MTAEIIPFDPARVSVTVWCYPFEETRTPNNPCYWVATCEIAGRVFEARSRRDAPRELARAFLAAGIPDRPMRITYAGVRGTRRYGSFHAEAAWTTVESATVPVRRGRFSSLADAEGSERLNSVIGGGPKTRNTPPDVSLHLPPPPERKNAAPTIQICQRCGREFRPAGKWATLFCSGACRQAAYRDRRDRLNSVSSVL